MKKFNTNTTVGKIRDCLQRAGLNPNYTIYNDKHKNGTRRIKIVFARAIVNAGLPRMIFEGLLKESFKNHVIEYGEYLTPDSRFNVEYRTHYTITLKD